MFKIKALVFSFLISLSISVFAQTAPTKILLITDIDDTIKISSSRNYGEFARNLYSKNQFTGMADLFHMLNRQSELVVAYVTNGPTAIQDSRYSFLKFHDYPKGEVFFKENLAESKHKLFTIRKLIQEHQPSHVIMLGDNASHDPEIYIKIMDEFSNQMKLYTFIHRIYPDKYTADESRYFSYITSVELALQLHSQLLVSDSQFEDYYNKIYPQLLQEIKSGTNYVNASLAFPSFIQCTDYKWTLPRPNELIELINFLEVLCHP